MSLTTALSSHQDRSSSKIHEARWKTPVRKFFRTLLHQKKNTYFSSSLSGWIIHQNGVKIFRHITRRLTVPLLCELPASRRGKFSFFRTEATHSPILDRDQKTLSVGNLDVTRRGFRACALDRLIERKGERERRFIILCNHFPISFFCASFHATEPTKRKGTKEKLISGSTVAYVASDNASKKCWQSDMQDGEGW